MCQAARPPRLSPLTLRARRPHCSCLGGWGAPLLLPAASRAHSHRAARRQRSLLGSAEPPPDSSGCSRPSLQPSAPPRSRQGRGAGQGRRAGQGRGAEQGRGAQPAAPPATPRPPESRRRRSSSSKSARALSTGSPSSKLWPRQPPCGTWGRHRLLAGVKNSDWLIPPHRELAQILSGLTPARCRGRLGNL